MPLVVDYVAGTLMIVMGLRLSAFFSGAETGFYRLSIPRLTIEAGTKNKRARQLLWFTQNPAYFVATCLIGNNVANYVTTFAIGWWTVLLFGGSSDSLEIAATLLLSPIIFQFAELLPKSVYYMAPFDRLRSDVRWFVYVFRVFLPLSWPLVQITRLLERVSGQQNQPAEIVLGRNRLTQLVQHGRDEGVLTDVQSRLANGLLQLAPQSATTSMTPVQRILGIPDNSSREEFIDFSQRYGLPSVPVCRPDDPNSWYGYVSVSDLLTSKSKAPAILPMPRISYDASKLQAMYTLQIKDVTHGVVVKGDTVLGLIARNGLVEQIFRPETVKKQAVV